MQYASICEARFLSRPNRFVAQVLLGGAEHTVHVKNTGRCRELLLPGARVFLSHQPAPGRRTAYDLVAVYKGERLINMDAAAPNQAAAEWLRSGGWGETPTLLRPEATMGDSRFDFYCEFGVRRCFLEVKGVTLEEGGMTRFPDAPTLRGLKHLRELTRLAGQGYETGVLFVIQMEGVRGFTPNRETHPAFADALWAARDAGVRLLAMDCRVTPDSMVLRQPVPILVDANE